MTQPTIRLSDLTWGLRLSRFSLFLERVGPSLISMWCWFFFWLMISFLGMWLSLTPTYRLAVWGVVAVSFLIALIPLIKRVWRGVWPSEREALYRLDASVAHHPARSTLDHLATGQDDELTQSLWQVHHQQQQLRLSRLRWPWPRSSAALDDRYALRGILPIACVAAAIVAGPDIPVRLASAFTSVTFSGAPLRIDGWVTPPAYTRKPPVVLKITGQDVPAPSDKLNVPVNSVVRLQTEASNGLNVTLAGGLVAADAQKNDKPDPALAIGRYQITGSGQISIRVGFGKTRVLTFSAVPDTSPVVILNPDVDMTSKGTFTLHYTAYDDYGLASLEAVIAQAPSTASARPLIVPPVVALPLPPFAADGDRSPSTRTIDLSEHPWAGASVTLRLRARDEAGQSAESSALSLTLPQRAFTNPLAKALIEQRRILAQDAGASSRLLKALDALLIAPEVFTPLSGDYLGLRLLHRRLETARTDEDLIDVVDLLWQMALWIEEGDLSQAKKAVDAAREALEKALERGASAEELAKLQGELRQAMDRFVKEMLARDPGSMRQNSQKDTAASSNRSRRVLTPEDIAKMLSRIEELTRNGDTAQAKQLLDELKNILENLQTARPRGPVSPEDRARRQAQENALADLDAMSRDQETLRDETFRERTRPPSPLFDSPSQNPDEPRDLEELQDGEEDAQAFRDEPPQDASPPVTTPMPPPDPRGREARPENRQANPLAPSLPLPGAGQTEKPSPRGQRKFSQKSSPTEDMARALSQKQQALHDRLDALRKGLDRQGAGDDPSLGQAQEAMKQADQHLGQGFLDSAVDAQGQALEALRQGRQKLADLLQSGDGEGDDDPQTGGQNGTPQAERGDTQQDPLGRSRNAQNGPLTRQGSRSGLELKVEDIVRELRRRLGDPSRAASERDYLERLLKGQ